MTQTAHTPGPKYDPAKHERNSNGERLYLDSSGAKCNIRGMIRRDPEWVASRFEHMMDRLADLEGIMPDYDPSGDRTHPAWKTIDELSAAIAKAQGKGV